MSENRLPSLDGLRALSITLVIIGHASGTVGAPKLLYYLHNLGNFGVKLFFVISGFIITYLLLLDYEKTANLNLKSFYLRRTYRLFPAFYFYVLCIAIAYYLGWISLLKDDLLHALSYTMNFHHQRSWWLNHTWSLAVEEQFYLLWPGVLLYFGSKKSYNVILLVIVCCPMIRAMMWYLFDAAPSAMTREFQAMADGLAIGCLLAYHYKLGTTLPKCLAGTVFYIIPISMFIIPAVMMKIHPALFYIVGQSYINVCAALIIWRFLVIKQGYSFRLLNVPIVMWLGNLSYSLYLWQEPFLNSWITNRFAHWPLNLCLAFFMAIFSYYFIEQPFLNKSRASRIPQNKTLPKPI